jgi:hypothetical protein
MWSVYAVIGYFLLALLIPVCWALLPVWRRSRAARQVNCPAIAGAALIRLDPWYAMRGRVAGRDEFRVRDCSQWPARDKCAQQCLDQLRPTA